MENRNYGAPQPLGTATTAPSPPQRKTNIARNIDQNLSYTETETLLCKRNAAKDDKSLD